MAEKLFTSFWDDYELIDAGGGKKLERWGEIITIRPELQAYFRSGTTFDEWRKSAHWEFIPGKGQNGKWKNLKKAPSSWQIKYKALVFNLQLTSYKHVGLFPEQRSNWDFIAENCNGESRALNLFAYTGAMSCITRNKGAETFHVDSVKQVLSWAAANMEASRLLNIKWVHDDVLKFVKRLEKREEHFDIITMDPPAWGVGAKNEKWKLEDQLDLLVGTAAKLLTPNGRLVLNTYSPKVDILLLCQMADLYFPGRNAEVRELWMKTRSNKELYFGNVLRVS